MATEDAVLAVIKASRPTLRNPHDKIAFALHSAFLASGYTLIATGAPAFSDTIFSSPPSDEVGIEGWNETEDGYGFVYSKTEKGLKKTVLVKCLVMGDSLVVDALSSNKEEPLNFQINADDYDGENASTNYADKYTKFADLVKTLNSELLKKIEGSMEPKGASASAPSRSEQSDRFEQNQHEHQGPEPYPPRFTVPPVLPGHHDDLYPGPGAGMYPRGGPDIGGPMLIGPNDPRWFGPVGRQPGFPDGSSIIPPGARYDPIGPSGVPGFEPNRFVRNPRRPGGHPDLEHFGNPDFI